jgi:hypothetical protein
MGFDICGYVGVVGGVVISDCDDFCGFLTIIFLNRHWMDRFAINRSTNRSIGLCCVALDCFAYRRSGPSPDGPGQVPEALFLVYLIASFLSLIGASIIIGSFFFVAELRKFPATLVVFLSVCDFWCVNHIQPLQYPRRCR